MTNNNEKIEALNEAFNQVCNIKSVLREEVKLENPHAIYDLLKTVQVLLRKEIKRSKPQNEP